ncbi:sigma-70 family RNA polymerase sigma factor [Herpetosiphon giganteus]|uniref:sigma-70 family RNA polymerase sigma factor n=1 Tax=Herpetosiphon giganteus TaxID=2029754 RepID=UPI0019594D53|nr:sigma-70 family RNA polymerase sigma factor [Herpetosiphon giganteus]MBM7845693.1 RNA polymerase sigma factor (sigma-70 family) [Herpetosiphon giganteus]
MIVNQTDDLSQYRVLLATLNREHHWQLTQTEQDRYLQQLKPCLLATEGEQRLNSMLANYHYDHGIVAKFQTGHGFDQQDWKEWLQTVRTVLAKNGLDWSRQIATSHEDLVQIALNGLLEALPSYCYRSRFKTWAYKVFLRSVLQHLRLFQASKRTAEILSLDQSINDQSSLEVADSHTPDPAEQTLANTLQSLIYRVLQQHSDQRLPEIFRLAKEVDLTVTEIGQRFQLSPGRISDLLKQARHLLQQHPTIRDWYNPDSAPDEAFN